MDLWKGLTSKTKASMLAVDQNYPYANACACTIDMHTLEAALRALQEDP